MEGGHGVIPVKNMMKKIITMIMLVVILLSTEMVFASNIDNAHWWNDAYNFFNGSGNDNYNFTAIDTIQNMIAFVGNMVFFIATTALGVKYIWGSVESKASVKDSLATLVVAAVFFYGWSTIRNIFIGNNGLFLIQNGFTNTAQSIYSTILYICNFLAVGGIIYVGIRYMLSGAEGKAQLKAQSIPLVLGIIMVYATLTFLTFIVNALML